MWVPFFHKNLDYLETLGYHFGEFFSGGGVVGAGMVTLHPVGLPHGPKPRRSAGVHGRRQRAASTTRSRIMADFANPPRSRSGRSGSAVPTT